MSTGDTFRRTIQLFPVDGKPTGLREATTHGWTGLLFVSGASAFGDLTARDEVDRTAAAAVVLDRNSSGRIEWKVKGSKQTYHDWQQAQATSQEAAQ